MDAATDEVRLGVCSVSSEKRASEQNRQLTQLTAQRDSSFNELGELKIQMRLIEDCREAAKRDLADAAESIRRGRHAGKFIYFIYLQTTIMVDVYK